MGCSGRRRVSVSETLALWKWGEEASSTSPTAKWRWCLKTGWRWGTEGEWTESHLVSCTRWQMPLCAGHLPAACSRDLIAEGSPGREAFVLPYLRRCLPPDSLTITDWAHPKGPTICDLLTVPFSLETMAQLQNLFVVEFSVNPTEGLARIYRQAQREIPALAGSCWLSWLFMFVH